MTDNKKILRVEMNPMMPHEAADRLRQIAKQLGELRLDQEMESTTPDMVWSFKLPANKVATVTIHYLCGGLPLCSFTTDVPAKWPDGHRWSGNSADINCQGCIANG